MGENIRFVKFDIKLRPGINIYKVVHGYNKTTLGGWFPLVITDGETVKPDPGCEFYLTMEEFNFIRFLTTISESGTVQIFTEGYNEYSGYEWDASGVYRLKATIVWSRGDRIQEITGKGKGQGREGGVMD